MSADPMLKSRVEHWANTRDTIRNAAHRVLQIPPSEFEWPWTLTLDATLKSGTVSYSLKARTVAMAPLDYAQLRDEFINQGYIPVPSNAEIATVIGLTGEFERAFPQWRTDPRWKEGS